MEINDLPVEVQNKIFYFCAEHPFAKIFKEGVIIKKGNYMGEHLAFFWRDSHEWFKSTYLNEDKMRSFLIESNINGKNIGKMR